MFFKVQLLKKPENVSQILPQRSGKILHYLKTAECEDSFLCSVSHRVATAIPSPLNFLWACPTNHVFLDSLYPSPPAN
jgi:hypothetical protein